MTPELQGAQHLVAQWFGGAAVVLLLAIAGFNEWRHRVTVDKLVTAIAIAIDKHNERDDAHAAASMIHKQERADGFAEIKTALNRIEMSIQRIVDKVEYNTGRIDRLSKEHEGIMRDGGHHVVCAECKRAFGQRRVASEEEREEWRRAHAATPGDRG